MKKADKRFKRFPEDFREPNKKAHKYPKTLCSVCNRIHYPEWDCVIREPYPTCGHTSERIRPLEEAPE